MELLDTSIANVSLPHIAGGLATSYDESTWVLTSYLIANAVVLPLSAWLSRVFGRKRYYMACVASFSVSSVLCGLAPSLAMLIVFRVLQGIGGGGLAPVEQAILVDTFPDAKRAAAFALYSMAIVTAPAIGPILGGWITDSFSWRWIFFIHLPLGLISLFLTSRLVSDPPAFREEVLRLRQSGHLKVDVVGILLVAAGFACLEVVLDRGQREDWLESPLIVAFLVVSLLALAIGCLWEWHHDDPVVEVRLLKNRNSALESSFYFLFGIVLFGSTVLIPQLLQALTLHRDGCRAGPRSRSIRDRAAGAAGRPASQASAGPGADHAGLCRPRAVDVVLRELQSFHRLSARGRRAGAAGTRLRVPVHSDQPAGLLEPAGEQEQQGVEPDESVPQSRWQRRHRVRHHAARTPDRSFTRPCWSRISRIPT
jgi:MFS family permease